MDPKPQKAKKHRFIVHDRPQPLENENDTFAAIPEQELLSSQPWRLRGPVWSKPAAPPPITVHEPVKPAGPDPIESSPPAEVSELSKDLETGEGNNAKPPLPLRAVEPTHDGSDDADLPAGLADLPSDAFEDFDVQKELNNLPSDAFVSSSSSPGKSPRRTSADDPISLSSQSSPQARPSLAAPRNAQMQMNLYGQVAKNQANTNASSSNKRYSFPAPQREEPPTHHKLDESAMHSWIYPMNIGSIRDYQYNIVQRGLFNNLLVALPTGLGKTFIAATIMLNWYRWTKDAQIVFVAPTKPLVAQQVDACFGIAGIPRSVTTMLTGSIQPGLRAEEWQTKRVFFTTPQTVHHDFQSGIADPKKLVLLVVDEAHRATGNYAYVQLVKFIRRFNPSFRVLALTATPGNNVEAVQEVIHGLDIARVEIRTEFSLDIRQYVHQRKTDRKIFTNSEEMDMILDWFSKSLQPVVNILCGQNAYYNRDPLQITPYGLTQARQKWMGSEAGRRAHVGTKAQVNRIITVLASLAHSLELLKYHGLGPFYHTVKAFRSKLAISKGSSKYESMINDSEHFSKMMTRLQFWINNPDFIGHPKLEYLQGLVLEHFSNTSDLQEVNNEGQPPRETRIMIFAHFRDSAEEICRVLRRSQPMIRPHVFVGQSSSKGSEGMDQKKQQEIITKFKSGEYNTLVATSIGEEGLDIGEVDLIVCYDSSASPIRMLQRMGRTGRKRAGAIVLLLMRGKEEDSFIRAKDNYEKMQSMISIGDRFEFHDDKSPRILPKECNPEPERRHVEIPVENTQAPLPEPTKKGRRAPKRPPKKFHMPDDVRTGFVRASRMDASGSDSEVPGAAKGKRLKRPTIPEKDLAAIPTHESVQLSSRAYKDFERSYLRAHGDVEDLEIMAPETDRFPEALRKLQPAVLVKHGASTMHAIKTVRKMRAITTRTTEQWDKTAEGLDIGETCGPIKAVDDISDVLASTTKGKGGKGKTTTGAKRGRPRKDANAAVGSATTTKPVPKPKPKPAAKAPVPNTPAPKRARGRPPGNKRFNYADPSSMTGASSSPPPTDPCFALPTQGIDLGSDDTEGDDDGDGYMDSSLRGFVVGSEDVIEEREVDGDDLGSASSSEEEGFGGSDVEELPRTLEQVDGDDDDEAGDRDVQMDEDEDGGGDEQSEDDSLPDVDTLIKSGPAQKPGGKMTGNAEGRAGSESVDVSPASKRLSQAMAGRGDGRGKRKRVVVSEDDSDG